MTKRKGNQKRYQYKDGIPIPRVYYKKAHGKKSARCLVKCGDCDSSLEIYYETKRKDAEIYGIEIGGVLAPKKEWQKILLPFLKYS